MMRADIAPHAGQKRSLYTAAAEEVVFWMYINITQAIFTCRVD